jgi:hypothetical protein
MAEEVGFMQNNAKVGGILSIVSGAFGVLWLVWALFAIIMFRFMVDGSYYSYDHMRSSDMLVFMTFFYAAVGIFLALVGVLAIIGGVFAIRKEKWGLALAGAIAGTVTFFPCGIPAIIFVSLAKPEFCGPSLSPPAPPTFPSSEAPR